ncbi:MAG: Two-component transcriptional response regulator, LuxR family [uncultured Chthoniobacterales bacterium]|uniref:Two-component transcriptional response regulator, LuxR family n=1 Tax=uncultured Chthoniobacterales bacterium TaxID=1836801 RepID=A0A6J4H8Q8_9BACT|nr:MAG: Two-component transcriptional response regulator, LuxR family [uncultured Chthoniobacterales bacterium]
MKSQPSQASSERSRSESRATSIAVVDDHRFMRDLIMSMLRRQDGRYDVVGEAADIRTAVALCEKTKPDLLVLDINLPDGSGIDAVPRVQEVAPQTRILLCTADVSESRVVEALRSGAQGFVEKTNTWDAFVEAVDRVAAGQHYFSAESAPFIDARYHGVERATASTAALSPREKEVLQLVATGQTSKEIAQKLGISVGTVDVHRANLMKKLHLRNVAGLVAFAFQARLMAPG